MVGGRGRASRQSPTTSCGRDRLSPGEAPALARPRRLSAPCGPQPGAKSAPASPAHRPSSPRASSDVTQGQRMSSDAWVCPNDRQLALRAKLHSGWSVKTATINQWKQPEPLTTSEQQMIVDVIKRAEQMEKAEKTRLEAKNLLCVDCNKAVCTKCGVECTNQPHGGSQKETAWLCKICAESRELWKKSGAWFFKGLPKPEVDPDLKSFKLGEGHKKERRFTVYKPARIEKDDQTEVEVEESSEDEATGELAKRGLGKVADNRSESDLSCGLSQLSSMESLNTLEAARRLSDVGYYSSYSNQATSSSQPPHSISAIQGPRGFPGPFRGRPTGHRPFHPRSPHPPHGPPWPQGPAGRPLSSPRCRAPSTFGPRGSPRGRYHSPRGGRQSRPVSCPPRRTHSNTSSPIQPSTPVQVSSVEVDSNSDSELTEVPFSPVSADGKLKNGKGNGELQGVFSTLRRLSTVSRKTRSKKKMLDFDKDIEIISENESGIDTVATGGYVSRTDSRSLGSDDTASSPRTPDGSMGILEFALIYDEINQILMVNILRAKHLKGLDVNGLCDSYCKVTLQPPIEKITHQRTRTITKNTSPQYNSHLHFPHIEKSDLSTLHMHIAILDEDISGDHLLAEARVSLVKIFPQLQKQFQVCLHRPNFKDGEDGFIMANNCGKIQLSLAFYSQHGTLKVGIVRCQSLSATDPQRDSADPFVRVVLLPESSIDCRKKTTIKWDSFNPEFNEQFVYMTNIIDLPKQSLSVTIWNHNKGKQHEYIGGLILGLNAKGERLRHWASLIKHPNKIHMKTHSLSANFLS